MDNTDRKASETRLKAFLARYIEQKDKTRPLEPQEAAALACLKFSKQQTLNQSQIGALIVGTRGKPSKGSPSSRMTAVMKRLTSLELVTGDHKRKRSHLENCYRLTQKGEEALLAFERRVLQTPANVHDALLNNPDLHYAEMIRIADPMIELYLAEQFESVQKPDKQKKATSARM